jgi:uncharacterized membrane protein
METIGQTGLSSSSSLLIALLIFFVILILAQVLALFLHMAGFTVLEVVLLVAFPLLAYLSALPATGVSVSGLYSRLSGTVFGTARVFDVPLIRVDGTIVGFNVVGCSIPIIITLKMLMQRRVPARQFCLIAAIIAGVTYLYTFTVPGVGMVIYLFAIPPILAAAIAFMLRKMKKTGDFNPALLSYASATIGVLVGADVLNLYRVVAHHAGSPVFISVGGGSVLDAIFLAGIVALFADVVFRSQEENVLRPLVGLFRGGSKGA